MFSSRYLNICGVILFLSLVNINSFHINNEQCFNHCSNDAICLIEDNSPKCYCLPKWDGELCDQIRQIEVINQLKAQRVSKRSLRNSPCSYLPDDFCKNGGFCFTNGTRVACQCKDEYDGPHCEEISVCNNYCYNDGVCTSEGTSPNKTATCKCNDKYEGTRCQSIKTTTTPQPPPTTTDVLCGTYFPDYCKNGGRCTIVSEKVACVCPTTHTGKQCETAAGGPPKPPTDPPVGPGGSTNSPGGQTNPPGGSTNSPGGQTNSPGGQTNSPGGQTNPPGGQTNPSSGNGDACGTYNPCQNSATCFNTGNTYYCSCAPKYSGNNCQFTNG